MLNGCGYQKFKVLSSSKVFSGKRCHSHNFGLADWHYSSQIWNEFFEKIVLSLGENNISSSPGIVKP